MNKANKTISLVLAATLALSLFSCGEKPRKDERVLDDAQYAVAQISGVDALGRVTYASDTRQAKRDVGLFYFLWLGAHGSKVYDVTEMEENCPEEIFDPQSKVSPVWQYHFWGKPLYGYYRSNDPWVLTRHIEMFTAAGIDFLIFDTSNGPTYDNVVVKLLEIAEKFRLQGFAVPRIVFMTNSGTKKAVTSLYNNYYAPDAPHRYPELWYCPNGKPLILSDIWQYDTTVEQEATLVEFFEMRAAQWPNALYEDEAFPWMDWNYPQYNHNGTMSVSVAQHTSGKMSQKEGNWGRGFSFDDYLNNSDRVAEGSNIQGQWETVFRANADKTDDNDVTTVFVTGWNEWIAIKKYESADVFYVDQFDTEYSRDIEPDSGAYGDNYYMQLVQNIRKYAYTPAKRYAPVVTKFTDGGIADAAWESVRAYPDFVGDALERNHKGYDSNTRYTDTTNRNDIASVKVAVDTANVYFRIECADDILGMREDDAGSLCVWINPANTKDFPYMADCLRGKLTRLDGAGAYEDVRDIEVTKEGKTLVAKVPLSALSLKSSDPSFRFRVSDNVDASDPMHFYIQGDSAPIGRLSYTYGYLK